MNETAVTRALTLSSSFVDRGVVLVETDDVQFLVAQGKQGQVRHALDESELSCWLLAVWRLRQPGQPSQEFEKNRLFTEKPRGEIDLDRL